MRLLFKLFNKPGWNCHMTTRRTSHFGQFAVLNFPDREGIKK